MPRKNSPDLLAIRFWPVQWVGVGIGWTDLEWKWENWEKEGWIAQDRNLEWMGPGVDSRWFRGNGCYFCIFDMMIMILMMNDDG